MFKSYPPMVKFIFKLIKFLLFPLSLFFQFRCSSGYKEQNGKITYDGKEIDPASLNGLVILNEAFAKDSLHGHYRDRVIESSEGATFEALDKNYAKDKNTVYYCTKERDGRTYYTTSITHIYQISGAIPATFRVLDSPFAKDSKQAYFEGNAFWVKDPASFTVLENGLTKDNAMAYYQRKAVPDSEGSTFALIDRFFAKDRKHVFYYGTDDRGEPIIQPLVVDTATFTRLQDWYSKDHTAAFYKAWRIPGSDPASFQVLSGQYSKDKGAVYYEGKKIPDADAATFAEFSDGYGKDQRKVFFRAKALPGADPLAFKVLEMDYATDGKNIYYQQTRVKEADPGSFKAYPHGIGNADSEDKTNKYYQGKKVTDDAMAN